MCHRQLIGMSLPVDTISIATRMLLAKHGLKEPAFRTKELIDTPIRAQCLSEGECDAVPLGQPDDIVFAQKGFTKLGDSLEVIPVLQFNCRPCEGRDPYAVSSNCGAIGENRMLGSSPPSRGRRRE